MRKRAGGWKSDTVAEGYVAKILVVREDKLKYLLGEEKGNKVAAKVEPEEENDLPVAKQEVGEMQKAG